MGGEHHVSFHNNSNNPCCYIHRTNIPKKIANQKDLIIWPTVKKEILWFIDLCEIDNTDKHNLFKYFFFPKLNHGIVQRIFICTGHTEMMTILLDICVMISANY